MTGAPQNSPAHAEGFDYDLFVIGGGSGGVRAARVAAQAGARVALAEESRMGGTCVIRGCVPKKLMVYAADVARQIADAPGWGWTVDGSFFDWATFRARLHAELARLEGVYQGILERNGITRFDARARLADPHTVELADGRRFSAAHVLIATGGRPWVPARWAHLGAMVSDDVFEMADLPASILVVGGGYIACEMAGILRGMGVTVTQIYRGPCILRGFDDETRAHLQEELLADGLDLRLNTDLAEAAPAPGGGFDVRLTDGSGGQYAQILFATGRRPNSDGIGLAEAGVGLTPSGAVVVDEYSQTAVPSVFAVGDVTERVTLTPVAIREGHAFADTVFGARPRTIEHDTIASAVFTRPELGSVGLTEAEARALGPVDIYATRFRPMHSAFAGRAARVMMKLIVAQESRKVLGCHIVGDHAGEMIQLAAIALRMGATKDDFDRTVAVHPTMAEELVTMADPVRSEPRADLRPD